MDRYPDPRGPDPLREIEELIEALRDRFHRDRVVYDVNSFKIWLNRNLPPELHFARQWIGRQLNKAGFHFKNALGIPQKVKTSVFINDDVPGYAPDKPGLSFLHMEANPDPYGQKWDVNVVVFGINTRTRSQTNHIIRKHKGLSKQEAMKELMKFEELGLSSHVKRRNIPSLQVPGFARKMYKDLPPEHVVNITDQLPEIAQPRKRKGQIIPYDLPRPTRKTPKDDGKKPPFKP